MMAQKLGDQIRKLTMRLAETLARLLGREIGGMPSNHQGQPGWDRNHWLNEVKAFLKDILKHKLTNKQLLRELLRKFTPQQLAEIRQALQEAFRMMNQDPPDFPPLALP